MILIADSGSTKCDWVLIDGQHRHDFSTMGFNPFFHNEQVISDAIRNNKELFAFSEKVKLLFLYSAGCSSRDLKSVVERGLKSCFPKANIYVDHDLVAAAFATYSGSPGISCILGTGSNSCYFDGDIVKEQVPALGYILGDEGSGSYYGKQILAAFLYKQLPAELHHALESKHKLNKDVIFEHVYMKPHANVYLASFMPVITEFKHLPYVRDMVHKGMIHFMKNHVICFRGYQKYPVHFIGSIAHLFEDVLREAASELDVKVGNIIQKPIYGLVDYHLKYLVGAKAN
ncbi:MAG: ATPase [Bacteroidota bacterium]|jgi:glucosamine kinase